MAFRNNKFNIFIKAVDENKAKEKAEETKLHITRLCEMQRYVSQSPEKLKLLLKVITEVPETDEKESLLQKGVIVYVELLETVELIREVLEKNNIKSLVITSKTSQKQREAISNEFMEDPHNKVLLFSAAGSESLDMHSVRDAVLYDSPKGPRAYAQTLGRVARGFGEFNSFNIHEIIVEDTLDEYKQILLSSKRELEQTILNSDTIPLKHDVGSFDAQVLKKVRAMYLWKTGKRKRKPTL